MQSAAASAGSAGRPGPRRPRGDARRCGARSLRRTARALVVAGIAAAALPCALSEPVAAAPPDATPLEVFREHFRDRDPKVRRQAVAQLAGVRGPAAVEALVEALGDADERVRDTACEALRRNVRDAREIEALAASGLRGRRVTTDVRRLTVRLLGDAGPAASVELLSALSDRDAGVREAAADALGSTGGEPAVRGLHELLADREAPVRAAAIDALGRLTGADAVGAAAAVLRGDRAVAPRVAAALVLAAHPRPESVEHLVAALRAPEWSVRVACARGLGALGAHRDAAREAVAALVPALDAEPRLRVADELAEALFLLTGIDFGPESARWNAWFTEAGRTFEPPAKPPRRSRPEAGGTHADLLDLPTASDHVTFVLDGSHSMSDPVRFGVETTKHDALLAAFERALERLPRAARANVIVFGSEPFPYRDELFDATPAARRAAVKFLAKRAPDGRTNIYDSLTLALADPDVDTLVLVTDGAPSAGARTGRGDILEGLRALNRHRLVRVHTVEIGAANTGARWRGFLRDIAELTGGTYLER